MKEKKDPTRPHTDTRDKELAKLHASKKWTAAQAEVTAAYHAIAAEQRAHLSPEVKEPRVKKASDAYDAAILARDLLSKAIHDKHERACEAVR